MSDKKHDKKKHAKKADKKEKKAAKKKAKKGKKRSAKASPKKLLKKLTCTGCKKRCPLSDPRCKKGRTQAEAALTDLLKKGT